MSEIEELTRQNIIDNAYTTFLALEGVRYVRQKNLTQREKFWNLRRDYNFWKDMVAASFGYRSMAEVLKSEQVFKALNDIEVEETPELEPEINPYGLHKAPRKKTRRN